MNLHVPIERKFRQNFPAAPAENVLRVIRMLVHARMRFVLIVVSKMRVTKATITLIVGSEIFFGSSALFLAAVAFDAVRRVELLTAVFTDVAGITGVQAHVE